MITFVKRLWSKSHWQKPGSLCQSVQPCGGAFFSIGDRLFGRRGTGSVRRLWLGCF